MNIDVFYSEIQSLLPVKRRTDDFRIDLKNTLSSYSKLIKSLDNEETIKIQNWEDKEARIYRLIEGILDAVNLYYEGLHSKAFTIIKNQLFDNLILEKMNLATIKEGEYFYRGRFFEYNRHKSHEDMFHIPLEMRGNIKTQRYSVPGYPCLYLGSSIYSCWEELGQPKFNDLMISAFQTTRELKLFDFRIPAEEDFYNLNFEKLLLSLPLIIACSFIVREEDKNFEFKAEYIIPQLLIELITEINRDEWKRKNINELILGVIFTSTHKNNDFDFPKRVFENIAIPVLMVSGSKGYCDVLSECFRLTSPTCYEYEELKTDFESDLMKLGLSKDEENEQKYRVSKMGKLENRIITTFDFLQFKFLLVSSPTEVELDWKGNSVSIDVRSNTDWEII